MRFLFLFLFVSLCSSPVFAQGKCDDAVIAQQVSDAKSDTANSNVFKDADTQVNMGIARGHLKPEMKEQMVSALIEFTLRKSAQCHIPNRLKVIASSSITITNTGEPCAVGQFSKVVNRQYNTLKSSTEFGEFESMIKAQVVGNMIDSVANIFSERWDRDTVFRANAIKSGLEMGIMMTNGCSNPQDPVLDVIAAF